MIKQLKTKNPDLKESEIEGLLFIIKETPGIENSELIRRAGLAKEILKKFKTSITQYLDDSNKSRIGLNDKGKEKLEGLNLKPHKWTLLSFENLELENRLEQIRKKYGLEYDVAKREYDQFFATPRSSLAKTQILKEKGLPSDIRIASIGDDDLLSVALTLNNVDYSELKIFEIDEDLVALIKRITGDLNIKNVHVQTQDIRNPLTKENMGKYDAVFIDPPYTREGVQLFLHRAVELLKPFENHSGSYIFLNFGAGRRNPEKILKIQEIIQMLNLVVEDKIDAFTRYYGAETVGSSSSMYILKTTPFTDVSGSVLVESIYTYESEPEERFPYVDHFVFKLKNVPPDLLTSKSALLRTTGQVCSTHKLRVIDTKVTKFRGKGMTLTFILASSNLLIHTWPEHNALHVDLITCSPIYDKQNLGKTFSDAFKTNTVYIQKIS